MASVTATISKYNQYNQTDNVATSKSGWHSWSSSAVMGYSSTWDAMAYKFKISSYEGSYSNTITKLKVNLYYQKVGSGNGSFYFYITSTDPTGYSLNDFKKNNTAWGSGAYTSSSSWHSTTFEISVSKTLSANTDYYLVVCGADAIQKVSSGNFSLKFDYTAISSVSKPNAPSAPTNNHNNTFSATCDAVSNPGGNPVTTTIQYKLGSNGSWVDAGSRTISNKAHSAEATADSQTVYVRIKADPTYGNTLYSNSSAGTTLKNYVPPTIPEEPPSVTKNKTRFTVKEPWVVSWTGEGQTSDPINNSSLIAGYRVVLQVKKATETEFKSVPIKNKNGTIISKNPSTTTWHTIDTINLGGYSITIYPDKQGFEPGDKVRVGIRPYILWGAANPTHYGSDKNTNKLFNETEDKYKYTEEITVQNAGVVRVKTGTDKSSFKEGIVWVKINNTGTKTTDWVEADVVKVKTANGWKESE